MIDNLLNLRSESKLFSSDSSFLVILLLLNSLTSIIFQDYHGLWRISAKNFNVCIIYWKLHIILHIEDSAKLVYSLLLWKMPLLLASLEFSTVVLTLTLSVLYVTW